MNAYDYCMDMYEEEVGQEPTSNEAFQDWLMATVMLQQKELESQKMLLDTVRTNLNSLVGQMYAKH